MRAVERLSAAERVALVVPLAGGSVFGLGALLLPQSTAALTGYAGADPLIARYAGAATLGYAVALAFGVWEGRARPLRFVLLATLAFNVASLFACLVEIASGQARPVVYAILVSGVVIIAIAAAVLRGHAEPPAARDVGTWVVTLLAILTVPAAIFGLFPLLAPAQFAVLFRLNGTDTFLFRQAGAATLGYAGMGIAEARSGRWNSLRLPVLMALVFNSVSFVASAFEIGGQVGSEGGFETWLPFVVAPVSLFATVATALILQVRGR
ncbi:MAG: hypothetical protein AUH85_03900 [Chloroflexi bacterium 13_1_40CM_4_68_4]|nr:MAG: hypothetical protein AUH85_03900 [Chloroflexi bacterium 13_1_40CM_4_68_4]